MEPFVGGLALFAQHLESKNGKRVTTGRPREQFTENVLPSWERLPPAEKQMWHRRAHDLGLEPARRPLLNVLFPVTQANTRPNSERHLNRRRRKQLEAAQRREEEQRIKEREDAEEEDEDEDDFGTLQPVLALNEEDALMNERMLDEKYARDRKMVKDEIMGKTGGCLEKIKGLRFLIASVQTFGNVDGVCMMAEYAMNELNLTDGVIDTFSTLVGPWTVENDVQRNRAIFHSNETHRIPLHFRNTLMDKRRLMTEILGRSEPCIARDQGVCVGLYAEGVEDCNEVLQRSVMGEANSHLLCDEYGRRWIICLRQELRDMMASCKHMRDVMGMDYDGFPCTEDRYVLADAFLDGIAECLDGEAPKESVGWLAALGDHLPEAFSTPWERSGELFCARHRADRNSCCATVTVSRASFILLYSLEHLVK